MSSLRDVFSSVTVKMRFSCRARQVGYTGRGGHRCREYHTEMLIDGYYHEGKFAAEMLVAFLSREYGYPSAILRFFWPYAPYDRVHGLCDLYSELKDGRPLRPKGEYTAIMYISDIIDKITKAVEHAKSPPELFNIGNPEIVTRMELLEFLCDVAGFRMPDEVALNPDLVILPDTRKMEACLGPARISWQESVRRVHRAFAEDATRPMAWMFD